MRKDLAFILDWGWTLSRTEVEPFNNIGWRKNKPGLISDSATTAVYVRPAAGLLVTFFSERYLFLAWVPFFLECLFSFFCAFFVLLRSAHKQTVLIIIRSLYSISFTSVWKEEYNYIPSPISCTVIFHGRKSATIFHPPSPVPWFSTISTICFTLSNIPCPTCNFWMTLPESFYKKTFTETKKRGGSWQSERWF